MDRTILNGNEDPASKRWHIDRRIPVAVVVCLLLQLGTFVWTASAIFTRVSIHDQRLDSLEHSLTALIPTTIEIKTKMDLMVTQFDELKRNFTPRR